VISFAAQEKVVTLVFPKQHNSVSYKIGENFAVPPPMTPSRGINAFLVGNQIALNGS
jgi:hypothetical protein